MALLFFCTLERLRKIDMIFPIKIQVKLSYNKPWVLVYASFIFEKGGVFILYDSIISVLTFFFGIRWRQLQCYI
ncbi:hypothetical protein EBI00_05910 [Marinomonas hwangdonensis]|uniref:Uncharacterized protein n=1 Tax=Marinomonas hwangdonensis TaxID=1053647 RepID=A0A3M8Q5N3_9GAMM|nr:hypothetical protein EBI00_05910 [Marinomonas hwangdonensis]